MELSGNAKRALELVERNLSILYGADYFTQEEWIKIDCLIHKGRYVLSDGPPSNILEEPLMTFEESRDDQEDTVEIPADDSFCQTKSASIATTEETVSSPPSEHGDCLPSPLEPPSETPVETSDEDSYPQKMPTAEPAPVGNPSATAAPATVEPAEVEPAEVEPAEVEPAEVEPAEVDPAEVEPAEVEPAEVDPQPATSSHLPPGCTQEQLDEVRAFNAGLTKAGHKTRPKYQRVEEDPSDEWIDDYNGPSGAEQSYPSPPPTEREARVNTWADGVAKLPRSHPSPHIQSPTPNRSAPSAPAVEVLAEQFIQAHGRQPKSLNDFYQPNNPRHQLRRPESQASMKTTKTIASIQTAARTAIDQILHASAASSSGIVLGKVYTAQSGAPQKGIRFEVRPGDHIKVLKFVSGIMYIGQNLRSKEHGQFPETIFKRDPSASQPVPSLQRGLDQLENANAAEWDDVSSIKRPETTAPISRPYLGGGLAASRFSTAVDRTPPHQSTQAPGGDIASDMAGQIGKIINDKVEEILKARGVAPLPQTPKQASKIVQPVQPVQPAQSVQPKTETCWYWSVKNDCRFTAEECRDLHAFLPNRTGEPTNLRQRKPTWGALADSLPSPSSSTQPNLGVIGDALKAKGKTCYYWAVEKSCSNTAESCRYLHEYSPLGIAPKPPSWSKPQWKREWRSKQDSESMESEERQTDGDLVLEEVEQEEVDGWGQTTNTASDSAWGGNVWGDDKYKPPHIKALEDKVAQEAAGW